MTKKKKNKGVIYESDPSAEWYTPAPIRELARVLLGGVDFDPATCPENPLGARWFCTAADGPASVERWIDRLPLDVAGKEAPGVFMNPPYGRETPRWLEKLEQLHDRRAVNSLAFVPCRPGSRWYAHHTGPEGADLVCELRGRVTFDTRNAQGVIVPGDSPARWACVLLYRTGPYVSSAGLRWAREQLARFGQVRAAGRARRARAHRAIGALGVGRPRRPRPSDARQVQMFEGSTEQLDALPRWADNVIPLARREPKA